MKWMTLFSDTDNGQNELDRSTIDDTFKWDLAPIFAGWAEWESAFNTLESKIELFQSYKDKLNQGGKTLLEVQELSDELGMLAYKVYYYPALQYDTDQRKNDILAKKQTVQNLFARWQAATAWFAPELLSIPQDEVFQWIDSTPGLEKYRFPISELYRSQEHVLDEKGERLLALSARFSGSPTEAYSALSTADMIYPEITLISGDTVRVTPGKYRSILNLNPEQEDRRRAFEAHYGVFEKSKNTYAALYNSICQRDWFKTQSRNYPTTLEASLFSDNVPRSVVDTLIATTKDGIDPLQKWHRLRKEYMNLDKYHLYDGSLALLKGDKKYSYEEACNHVIESVAPLGDYYQSRVREAFESRWIDVFENEGKRSGAYSAGVYGVHPYMLMNYNDTLDDVFTLAHEMGHSMHSILSNENQPFATSEYTIFVAEVASTLNEALLMEHLLNNSTDPEERLLLLQHTIEGITGTFYTQVMFADFELIGHQLIEQGLPLTAEVLNELYMNLIDKFYGDTVEKDDLYRYTWARIPHFYHSPYYVYQYATCYASSSHLMSELQAGNREAVLERYLTLLKSGGSDHPMTLLNNAGVDLSDSATIQAVITKLDNYVDRFEEEWDRYQAAKLIGTVSKK